jgi:hypothetical protein
MAIAGIGVGELVLPLGFVPVPEIRPRRHLPPGLNGI